MDKITEMLNLIGRYAEPRDVSGPTSDDRIREAETVLSVVFPPSYRAYLWRYGSADVGPEEFLGLTKQLGAGPPDAVWNTLREREYGLPRELIVVQDRGEDDIYCIDTRQAQHDGEAPIVVWVAGVPAAQQEPLPIAFATFADLVITRIRDWLARRGET